MNYIEQLIEAEKIWGGNKNRSKMHNFKRQLGVCPICKKELNLFGNVQLHHEHDKFGGKIRPQKGTRWVLHTECHKRITKKQHEVFR